MSSHRMPRHVTVTLVLGATFVALLAGCAEPRAASEANGATRTVHADGSRWDDVVVEIVEISGTHGPTTEGIFLAAGPDIDPAAQIDGISIHDIAPTVLYALGLPVGEDFAGEARRTLFTDRFRQARPLRTITTWGTIEPGGARTSAADRALVEELRSLGYLK